MKLSDVRPDVRAVKKVPWPGADSFVGILILNHDELQDAHFAARRYFKKKDQEVDGASMIQFLKEEQHQQMLRFLIDPDSRRPEDRICGSEAEARKIEPDERAYFMDQYKLFQNELIASWGLDDGKEETSES